MNARLPLILIAGLTLLAPGRAQAQVAAGTATVPFVIADRSGDTVDDDGGAPVKAPRGDIVFTGMDYTADLVRLAARVAEQVDPATDASWSSDSTFLQWELDTTGDAKPDYVAQFAVANGSVYGIVTRPNDPDGAPPVCDASVAQYNTASSSYLLGLPLSCLGTPRAIAYRATMYYDTHPKDDRAPVARDVSPDNGFAGPVARVSQSGPAAAAAPGASSASGPPSTTSPSSASSAAAPGSTTDPADPFATAPSSTPPPSGSRATTRGPAPTTGRATSNRAAPATSSTGRSSPEAAAGAPSVAGSHLDTVSPVAAPAGAGGPSQKGRGVVIGIAILAALLAWAGQLKFLAHRRRPRTVFG